MKWHLWGSAKKREFNVKRYEPGREWIRDGKAKMSSLSELWLPLEYAMEPQWELESSWKSILKDLYLLWIQTWYQRWGGWVWFVPECEFLLTVHNVGTSFYLILIPVLVNTCKFLFSCSLNSSWGFLQIVHIQMKASSK